MTDYSDNNMNNTQNYDFKGKAWKGFTDIHCHCLPNLDDGPSTVSEAFILCQGLAAEGIVTVVATPHQIGRFEGLNEAANIREAVHRLNEMLKNKGVPLNILPGSEVYLDERICQFLEEDKIITLADNGRYILLELPCQISIDITPLLKELAVIGVQCIISHAERIAPFVAQRQVVLTWLDHSAHIQITASSLMGDFGPEIQRTAWSFLSSGRAALVATDSHNIDCRRPRMKAAFRRISTRLGKDIAHLVCIENPSRVVNGQDVLPVSRNALQEVDR
jgi:protein-tyrosine phosphatase